MRNRKEPKRTPTTILQHDRQAFLPYRTFTPVHGLRRHCLGGAHHLDEFHFLIRLFRLQYRSDDPGLSSGGSISVENKIAVRQVFRRLATLASVVAISNSLLVAWNVWALGRFLTADAAVVRAMREHAVYLGAATFLHHFICSQKAS
jgi:hypothetical protein